MSYLLVVQVSAVLLPIMAFSPLCWNDGAIAATSGRPDFSVKIAFVHLAASIAMMLLFHGAYKQVNGLITAGNQLISTRQVSISSLFGPLFWSRLTRRMSVWRESSSRAMSLTSKI